MSTANESDDCLLSAWARTPDEEAFHQLVRKLSRNNAEEIVARRSEGRQCKDGEGF
jgi:hypothetical protein